MTSTQCLLFSNLITELAPVNSRLCPRLKLTFVKIGLAYFPINSQLAYLDPAEGRIFPKTTVAQNQEISDNTLLSQLSMLSLPVYKLGGTHYVAMATSL